MNVEKPPLDSLFSTLSTIRALGIRNGRPQTTTEGEIIKLIRRASQKNKGSEASK